MGRSKLFIAVVLLVALGAGVGGSWAAFRSTGSNSGDSIAAGTVQLTDNDSGSAMFSLTGLKAYDTSTRCIKVTNAGSLASQVRLYGTTTGTGLDRYLSVVVTRGSYSTDPGFSSCTNFVPDSGTYISGQSAGVIYSGTLQGFPDSYAAGLDDPASGSVENWSPGETHVYKIEVTVGDQDSAASKNATQAFTWEARNISGYKGTIMSTPGLKGYWRLGETSGSTASDSAGSNDGTYSGGVTLGQAGLLAGDSDTSSSFDGTDTQRVDLPNIASLSNSSFSLEAWVSGAPAGHEGTVISGWTANSTGNVAAVTVLTDGRVKFVNWNWDTIAPAGSVSGTAHIVAVYDKVAGTTKVYVNGVLRASRSGVPDPLTVANPGWRIGSFQGLTNIGFAGRIDEVAIYDTALSATQVDEHYQDGA